jgi:hypothetical protein
MVARDGLYFLHLDSAGEKLLLEFMAGDAAFVLIALAVMAGETGGPGRCDRLMLLGRMADCARHPEVRDMALVRDYLGPELHRLRLNHTGLFVAQDSQ